MNFKGTNQFGFVLGASQLVNLYQEHHGNQEMEEKLCKWTDANKLRAYEKDLLNKAGKTVGEMLDSWENPVFAAPEKVSHNVQSYQTSVYVMGYLTIILKLNKINAIINASGC